MHVKGRLQGQQASFIEMISNQEWRGEWNGSGKLFFGASICGAKRAEAEAEAASSRDWLGLAVTRHAVSLRPASSHGGASASAPGTG